MHLATDTRNTFINDTSEIAGWACFRPSETKSREISKPESELIGKPAPLSSSIKVGRNDPCPCGSGKKYKKCCLG
jgi:uncharacterized protein YecA (UPF0149 family)